MNLNPTIIKNVLQSLDYSCDYNTAERICERIQSIENIKNRIETIEIEKEQAYKEYKEKIRILNDKILEIKKLCVHPSTTYHPDPSGNNDSYRGCDICGQEVSY